jgi:hypothetical protein
MAVSGLGREPPFFNSGTAPGGDWFPKGSGNPIETAARLH